jgi:hypothetical protein
MNPRASHRIAVIPASPERAAPTACERAIGRQAARGRNGGRRLFSAAGYVTRKIIAHPALHRETK